MNIKLNIYFSFLWGFLPLQLSAAWGLGVSAALAEEPGLSRVPRTAL